MGNQWTMNNGQLTMCGEKMTPISMVIGYSLLVDRKRVNNQQRTTTN